MPTVAQELESFLDETFDAIDRALVAHEPALVQQEFGVVSYVGHGIARVHGLPGAQMEELVIFPGVYADEPLTDPTADLWGMVFNLDADEVGIVLLGASEQVQAGDKVYRSGRVMDAPVGPALLGRVIDAAGQPLDDLGPIRARSRQPIERGAPPIIHRAPVTEPLQTGIKVVDTLIPIGRGQRELILGDRQTGKTAIALDAIVNQADTGVICIYCAVGQRNAAVAKLIDELRQHNALRYAIVVVATGEDAPGLQFIAPYVATTIAEYFMDDGHDVLVVYDDLTHHARAYRELSLLLRRPPGREAYPGDIFYVHSRLLERSTHLRPEYGGGSLTALPIIETQAQDMSAYIPTNLISITDGQIVLSPILFRKGILPAVNVGRSVSRVGGKAQLSGYRAVAGDLRLAYAQFEELEIFSRFSTRLDDKTRQTLARGRHVREVLKQSQFGSIPAAEQLAVLLAVTSGALDELPAAQMVSAEQAIRRAMRTHAPDLCAQIQAGEPLTDAVRARMLMLIAQAVAPLITEARAEGDHADT